jgi:AcrR family transcriptional regulator
MPAAPTRTARAADRPAPLGNVKATREDWVNLALSVLARHGAAAVTVLDLSERLGVSRSSFYWYFRNREDLLDELLRRWENLNTRSIVRQSEVRAGSINEAICNVFRCWVDPELFSPRLDFAVREWARRSEKVRMALDRSDGERTAAPGPCSSGTATLPKTRSHARAFSISCRSATTRSASRSRWRPA